MLETELHGPKEEEAEIEEESAIVQAAIEAGDLPGSAALAGIPGLLRVSGLYKRKGLFPLGPAALEAEEAGVEEPEAADVAGTRAALPFFEKEELRLDVDGRYPQMTASGTLRRRLAGRVHWIAKLTQTGTRTWTGNIWYKDGAVAIFPYSLVKIRVVQSIFPHLRKATVRFKGGGAPTRKRTFRFSSPYFRKVEIEYDHESGVDPNLDVHTCAHPIHPASLPCERLEIGTVFQRTGFGTTVTDPGQPIPNDGPDPNDTWSDAEMHDAMQIYWSRFDNRPQWALWVLFARQHDLGHDLGGIMFDDIGPNHRQGTAIFYDSFISDSPSGDPAAAAAWVKRMQFWTAVHEIGHAFNLAHSWQKELGPPWGSPWIPLVNEPEARSFMNYPRLVSGGEPAFFADFEYRFSDGELLFMRHAPARFVQMGNADWFDHHGFEDAVVAPSTDFKLEIGIDRDSAEYDFLEPVVLELKVTNVSNEPKILPTDLLTDTEHMAVILKKEGKPARRWAPFVRYCTSAQKSVLQPEESMTESLFVSAGCNGWDLAEPGRYTVQMSMEVDGYDVVSNRLELKVTTPMSREEERLAQDVFTADAGRVMAFDGSAVLKSGNQAWQEVVDKLPKSKAALHAQIALAMPLLRNHRKLRVDASPEAMMLDGKGAFEGSEANVEEASAKLSKVLAGDPKAAVQTLGREDFEYYAGCLKSAGGQKYAADADKVLEIAETLRKGRVPAKGSAKRKKEKV